LATACKSTHRRVARLKGNGKIPFPFFVRRFAGLRKKQYFCRKFAMKKE
jgi:hypothetical protein